MPNIEYYTVDRSPQEVRDLWEWALEESRGKVEHENPYAIGVCATLQYLMGETEERPQDYKGVFSLHNVLRQSKHPDDVGCVSNTGIDKALHNDLQPLRPGNPKCILYKTPLRGGDITVSQGGVDNTE